MKSQKYFADRRVLKREYEDASEIHERYRPVSKQIIERAMDLYHCFNISTRYYHYIDTRYRVRLQGQPFIDHRVNCSFVALHPVAQHQFAPLYVLYLAQDDDFIVYSMLSGGLYFYDQMCDGMHESSHSQIAHYRLLSHYSTFLMDAVTEENGAFQLNHDIVQSMNHEQAL
jgi:hypothetical protein